jgi:hypothetical protein
LLIRPGGANACRHFVNEAYRCRGQAAGAFAVVSVAATLAPLDTIAARLNTDTTTTRSNWAADARDGSDPFPRLRISPRFHAP